MKRCLYVVDDQSAVLDTAVLILRTIEPGWEVIGFKDPYAALEAVKAKPPDLILSDQLMPGMQGSQLLEHVRLLCPGAIRIIMSGYVALNKLSLITSAHQYLAKPFDAVKLRETIRRSFSSQERLTHSGLQGLVTSLRAIPSLPQVHHSLLAELENSRASGASIARLVAEDPGVSSKVLQLANSPLFGQGQIISSPIDAVLCLGTDMIAAIVLSQTLFRHYAAASHHELDLKRIWSHCWETAALALALAREKRLPRESADAAFLAALMHESGRFILIDNFPEQYQSACDAARQVKSPLNPRLREAFRTSIPEMTGYLLELWGLPKAVVAAVSWLEEPQKCPDEKFGALSALYVADHLASRKAAPDAFPIAELDRRYLEKVGCSDDFSRWEAAAAA